MSTTGTDPRAMQPADAVVERLNDPAVAASLVTLLDNAELLSTLVLGLSGFIARSEFIMDGVVEGINDLRTAQSAGSTGLPSVQDVRTITAELVDAAPAVRNVLNSKMVQPETIELLGLLSEAATEGAATAREQRTGLGPIGAMKSLRDPEVQRGVGMFVEIARALGRRLNAADTGNG